ncbi:MAG TPA: isocitrate lyase/phosphoenolpyruvate mutase family protein [Rhodanobacteraceae bacterium]|nr:isocitrate lyase/phosphoenolpyruvate mutase family protein [Rhodanobacteraceae bacterium]
MTTQADKAHAFRALHAREGAFIIPNPWDVGSARILAGFGFEALATTSAGFAFSLGRRDGTIERDTMLAHAASIAAATELPVSADLENGYATTPDGVAETFTLAAATGIVGASIEDRTRDADDPLFDIARAAERVRAAAEAVHALPFPFALTARAENFLVGRPDLDDAIRRLQAYQDAGADVLYAPGLVDRDAIATLVREVDRPVNVVMGLAGTRFSLAELAEIGVKRVSVGSALARAALGGLIHAASEMRERGTFAFADEAIGFGEISAMLRGGRTVG